MDPRLMGILNGIVLIFIFVGVPVIIGVLAEKRRKRLDRIQVFKVAMLNRHTGRVTGGIVDLDIPHSLQLEDEVVISFEHIPGPHDTAVARLRDGQGKEQAFGLTMEENTYDHGPYRFTFLRCNGDLEAAKRSLEGDYFGREEGEDIDQLTPDKAGDVAASPAWCFIFADRVPLEHVVMPPKTWRRLRDVFDEDKMRSLPKARQVFYACGKGYDEEADKPIDSTYRRLPTREEVQGFADDVGKTIALYIAHLSGDRSLQVRRAFLVQPKSR